MRKFSRPRHTVGRPPGTLPATASGSAVEEAGAPIRMLVYDADAIEAREVDPLDDALSRNTPGRVTWIDLSGVRDTHRITALASRFALHPLLVEDIVNAAQRSKLEPYEDLVYLVVRALEFDRLSGEIHSTQISLVLTAESLLTFQESDTDALATVRRRLLSGRTRLRSAGAGYLAYSILDAVVDGYFLLLEELGQYMEALEEDLLLATSQDTLRAIHRLKREIIYLRKSVWPLREALSGLLREDVLPEQAHFDLYLRDLHDHVVQVMETIESYRDITAGMLEIHLSLQSNRMNEVMKTLTIIATLFIPLTFAVGVYGMNFDFMPELHWRWAYPSLWTLMIVVTLVMLRFFRRRGWL